MLIGQKLVVYAPRILHVFALNPKPNWQWVGEKLITCYIIMQGFTFPMWENTLSDRTYDAYYIQLGAEFVGTFILMFAASAGPIVNQKYNGAETLIGNAACAGLGVMIVILSTGHISGAHLNPSLTIAFAALRHFPWVQVPAYIAAQVSGSICASYALKGALHPYMSGGTTVPTVSTGQAFALEFIITFNLLFVVTAVATDTRAVSIYTLNAIWLFT